MVQNTAPADVFQSPLDFIMGLLLQHMYTNIFNDFIAEKAINKIYI